MKNWVLLLAVLFTACISAFGQEVDFSAYELVAKRGNVSVVAGNNEYRLIVGSTKKPKASLLLGVHPETAAAQLERISRLGTKPRNPGEQSVFLFCGEPFSYDVSGADSLMVYSFRSTGGPAKFSLSETDIRAFKKAILEKKN